MDNLPHRAAIEAFLDLDWLSEGQQIKLEDPDTRNGLLSRVIHPIEQEIEMIDRVLFF